MHREGRITILFALPQCENEAGGFEPSRLCNTKTGKQRACACSPRPPRPSFRRLHVNGPVKPCNIHRHCVPYLCALQAVGAIAPGLLPSTHALTDPLTLRTPITLPTPVTLPTPLPLTYPSHPPHYLTLPPPYPFSLSPFAMHLFRHRDSNPGRSGEGRVS